VAHDQRPAVRIQTTTGSLAASLRLLGLIDVGLDFQVADFLERVGHLLVSAPAREGMTKDHRQEAEPSRPICQRICRSWKTSQVANEDLIARPSF
jgi:hypothetical protein